MQFEDFNYAVYNPYILIEDVAGDREVHTELQAKLVEKEMKTIKLPEYDFKDVIVEKIKIQTEAIKDDNNLIRN